MTDKELQEIREWAEGPVTGNKPLDFASAWILKLLDEIDQLTLQLSQKWTDATRIAYPSTNKIMDIIQSHLDEIERLKAERQWISVKDRLPEMAPDVCVLVKTWHSYSIEVVRVRYVLNNKARYSHWASAPEYTDPTE